MLFYIALTPALLLYPVYSLVNIGLVCVMFHSPGVFPCLGVDTTLRIQLSAPPAFQSSLHALTQFYSFTALLCFSAEKLRPKQHLNVDLYLSSGGQKQRSEPRYSMAIVDIQPSLAKNGKFAIFIVPQGNMLDKFYGRKVGKLKTSVNKVRFKMQ